MNIGALSIAALEVHHDLLADLGDETESLADAGIGLCDAQPGRHHLTVLLGLPVKLHAHPTQVVGILVVCHLGTAGGSDGGDLADGIGREVALGGNATELVAVGLVGRELVNQLDDHDLVLFNGALLVGGAVGDVVVDDDQR